MLFSQLYLTSIFYDFEWKMTVFLSDIKSFSKGLLIFIKNYVNKSAYLGFFFEGYIAMLEMF